MTTAAQLHRAATSLPEVERREENGSLTYVVAGSEFASVDRDGLVRLHLSAADADQALDRYPSAKRTTLAHGASGISIPVTAVNGMELNSLVHKAWLSRAPQRLVSEREEADRGVAPGGSNALPKSIGKPATRALLGAGVRSLADVARLTEADLLALHGVGPKAVRILLAAVGEREAGA